MTTIKTNISAGYTELIKLFFVANNLDVRIEESDTLSNQLILHYKDASDTAYNITFMSVKHLGFENMLCDYLVKCGISPSRISNGRMSVKRDMDEVEKGWQEHRKRIGLR